MTNVFPDFARTVAASFQAIVKSPQAFVTSATGDDLYRRYLDAFPEGTNPPFKKFTEHECSCCRHFIRRVGNVVAIDTQGLLHTIWDEAAVSAPYPYDVVAAGMRDAVLGGEVSDLFRVLPKESSFGAATTRSLGDGGKALTWNHFYTGPIPTSVQAPSPGEVCGEYRTGVQVFARGLEELSPAALETVSGLIESNNLYRGAEHLPAVIAFATAQRAYQTHSGRGRNAFLWANATGPAARFRNTVIGTLIQDLTEGKDLEHAVASFETKVAPTNYKRTTAVITPAMVKKAMATIESLGLEPALERRFARLSDISVNDVKWVDGGARPVMKGGLADTLMKVATSSGASTVKDADRAEDIGLDAFVADVLPTATGVEVLLKGEHLGNLMSLTAPVHPEPARLFKWSNDFAWSYAGNVADSYLRQQVQSLGGRVDGVLRFSHMWNHEKRNASLMDLHVFLPGTTPQKDGCHDSYPYGQRVGWNMRNDRASGGVQDVDYVQAAPEGYVPVENITFPSLEKLKDGDYTFKIHNWQLRTPTLGGFRAEIEFGGQVFQYDHPEPLKNKEWITLAVATLKNGTFTIEHKHPVGTASQEKWGLTTGQYVPVDAVTLSPNFWGDNAVGNKHTFFVLRGAHNDEPTRGIYNEFLHSRLEAHRKVFEVIGDRTKCVPTEGEISGLGFSSTKKTQVVVRVQQAKRTRLYNVRVGA